MKREFKPTAENMQYIKLREDFLRQAKSRDWKRINHCQAWFTEENGMIWVKSYNTIVAVYNKTNEMLISFGRYSNTTYQHIRKFRNDYTPNMYMTMERNLEYENWY